MTAHYVSLKPGDTLSVDGYMDHEAYERGYNAGRAASAPLIYHQAYALRKLAGWVDAQQLPADSAHANEASARRRIAYILRNLADNGRFDYTGTSEALKATEEPA